MAVAERMRIAPSGRSWTYRARAFLGIASLFIAIVLGVAAAVSVLVALIETDRIWLPLWLGCAFLVCVGVLLLCMGRSKPNS